MIDTDKYEGHTPAPWKAIGNGEIEAHYSIAQVLPFVSPKAFDATANLIADAPLLLGEVKRLRSVIEDIESMIPDNHEEVSPILSDILSECHRVLPMFNEASE